MRSKNKKIIRSCITLFLVLAVICPTPVQAQLTSDVVWRIELRLVTNNSEDADTDDNVSVSLNQNNVTWLDYGRDDFEGGDDLTYDLLLTNIKTVSDIRYIKITKEGTDAWCIKEMELIVNTASYYMQRPDCRWLDGDDDYSPSLMVTGEDFLTSHLSIIPANIMKYDEIISLIESAVGHSIKSDDFYWGHLHGPAVEISRIDSKTFHVDLDLAWDVNNSTDPEVDMDYDIRFGCQNGQLTVSALNTNVDVDTGWFPGFTGLIYSYNYPLMGFSAGRLRTSIGRRVGYNCDVQILTDTILLPN